MIRTDANQKLALLKTSASTSRVLNLNWIHERYRDDLGLVRHPLFLSARLNQCIIIKHTLRPYERDNLRLARTNATKVILPFAATHLGMGGYSAFVEQPGFANDLRSLLSLPQGSADFQRDCDVLFELARLPSLDPYLMRERLKRRGYTICPSYFEVSEADVRRLEQAVAKDISQLVDLAYGSGSSVAGEFSDKLAHLLLTDDTSEALAPLRDTLRLTPQEHEAGMFGWKGFLYYKWLVGTMRGLFRPVIEQILSAHIANAEPDDIVRLGKLRGRVASHFVQRVQEIELALESYDDAFRKLVEDGKPSGFRQFLLSAPERFIQTGGRLAAVNHILSFWRFRYPNGASEPIERDDAFDLFREFDVSLENNEETVEI